MGERTKPRERQVWPNAGARPNWQSNMAAVRAGDGFHPRRSNPLSDRQPGSEPIGRGKEEQDRNV